MRVLLSFKRNMGTPDCPLKPALQRELTMFHCQLMKSCAIRMEETLPGESDAHDSGLMCKMREFLKSMVAQIREKISDDGDSESGLSHASAEGNILMLFSIFSTFSTFSFRCYDFKAVLCSSSQRSKLFRFLYRCSKAIKKPLENLGPKEICSHH